MPEGRVVARPPGQRPARAGPVRTIAEGTVVFTAALSLALACGGSPTDPATPGDRVSRVAATVAQVAAAVTGQEAPLADAVRTGRHLGFDTHTYPGDRTMRAWKAAPGAPYRWVGYYLPSPCHRDTSWVGRRDTLVAMGWGLAAVYVGQQSWGRRPRPLSAAQQAALLRRGTTCDADLLGTARGTADGADAIQAAARDGFPARSVIFLDIERMETVPEAMRQYYRAWFARLLADGRYRPGVYVHAHNARTVFDDLQGAFRTAGLREEPRVWIASGRGFEEGKAPQDVGFAFAGVWQGLIDVARAVANVRLPVDVNVSSWSSPSEPARLGD